MTDRKYSKLPDEMKLIVLGWMRDGLLDQVKGNVSIHSRISFVRALKGEAYDPEKIWEGVPQRSLDHLDHVVPYLIQLNDEIAEVKERLMPKTQELPVDPEIIPIPKQKPSVKKKQRPKKKGCRG